MKALLNTFAAFKKEPCFRLLIYKKNPDNTVGECDELSQATDDDDFIGELDADRNFAQSKLDGLSAAFLAAAIISAAIDLVEHYIARWEFRWWCRGM